MRQPAPGSGPRSAGYTGDRSPRAVARRLLSRYRRPVAAALAGTAVLVTVAAVRPPDAVTVPVVVAGGDLPAGVPLAAADLRVVDVPRACAPVGAERDPGTLADRVPITELRAGEAVTATRLVGGRDGSAPGAGAAAGLLAAPVRIADPGAVALLSPGDVVDVLAADETSGQASVVARQVRVLTVPRSRGQSGGGGLLAGSGSSGLGAAGDGSLVVLEVGPATALGLAQAAATQRLSLVLH